MASALTTMKKMNLHHGAGIMAAALGTGVGFGASVAIGTLYGKFRNKWYGQWTPALVAILGKAAAVGLVFGGARTAAVVANDFGQAGLNAIGVDLGVKLGLKMDGKALVVKEVSALTAADIRIAGQLPPADPGRSLENIAVEDLANLR
jgi:hypothetical protein